MIGREYPGVGECRPQDRGDRQRRPCADRSTPCPDASSGRGNPRGRTGTVRFFRNCLAQGCRPRRVAEDRTRADSQGTRADTLEPEARRAQPPDQLQVLALQDQTDWRASADCGERRGEGLMRKPYVLLMGSLLVLSCGSALQAHQDTAPKGAPEVKTTSDPDYKIGAQDVVRIDVWKEP